MAPQKWYVDGKIILGKVNYMYYTGNINVIGSIDVLVWFRLTTKPFC